MNDEKIVHSLCKSASSTTKDNNKYEIETHRTRKSMIKKKPIAFFLRGYIDTLIVGDFNTDYI